MSYLLTAVLAFGMVAAGAGDVWAMGRAPSRGQVDVETLHSLFESHQKSGRAIGGDCQVGGTRLVESGNVLAVQLVKGSSIYNLQLKKSAATQTVDHQQDAQDAIRTHIENLIEQTEPAGKLQTRQVIVYDAKVGKILQYAENQTRSYTHTGRVDNVSIQCGAFRN